MGNDSAIEETTSSSDNWVTVFGFSPDQAHSILQYMSRHGEVVMHQVPSKGNWMYVGYSCSTHARQALSRNGAVLDGNIRIGVIPTSEKVIVFYFKLTVILGTHRIECRSNKHLRSHYVEQINAY